jgi:hypothetical protein
MAMQLALIMDMMEFVFIVDFIMKRFAIFSILTAVALSCAGTAQACTFHWEHYGEDDVMALIRNEVGSHVTDEYCKRFNAKYELVITTNYYTNSSYIAGHATVGMRPRKSDIQPVSTYSQLLTDTAKSTIGDARKIVTEAAMLAVDDLMSSLQTYKVQQ